VHSSRKWFAALVVVLTASIPKPGRADSPHEEFVRNWRGAAVVVKQPLFTLVYNERGRLGSTHSNKRDGLTVVTPQATYLQVDGRQGREDIQGPTPQEIFDKVNMTYRGDPLEVRSYDRVEPIVFSRYDPGVQLVVKDVRFEKDLVRLSFTQPGGPDGPDNPVTSLTVKWAVPFSPSLSERTLIENLIRAFVDVR
jgi:hypothetical protein